jgi:hypothetical protein
MSKSGSGFGKPLKGISTTDTSAGAIEDSIINQISNGSIALTNINITGGTLDGVVVGTDTPGPVFATTIQSGNSDGVGYNVVFYGDIIGEYAQWDSTLGIWIVQGDLDISGTSNLGNIVISGNTVSTSNTNGDIIFNPNGNGGLVVSGSIDQSTTSGDITFATTDPIGVFSAEANQVIVSSTDDQTYTSNNGDITISSGANKTVYTITNITTGLTPTITTSANHNLQVGDSISVSLTNSTPHIDGTWTVASVVDADEFTIAVPLPITSGGNTGTFTKNLDIYLTADTSINIPYDVRLTFGKDDNYLMASSSPLDDLTIAADGDINITPVGDINVPNDVALTFGSDLRAITSDGTSVYITSNNEVDITATRTVLNSDLRVNGTSVSFDDPILTIAGDTAPLNDDLKDRGIEFQYYDGSAKLGFFGYDNTDNTFTYYLDATNTNEVISGTLGDAKFANGSFTSLSLNGGTISAGQIDVCNLYCAGQMNITGMLGINLTSPAGQSITIPQGTYLQFGAGNTRLYREASGDDLVIESVGHVFLTPGSTLYDVIIPQGNSLVLNGENGTQQLYSTSSELYVSSNSFLNLTQNSGGVRLTEGLPLLFNQNETSKITGDGSGNLIVNAENNLNLVPSSGHITVPVAKQIQFGASNTNIGTVSSGVLAINSSGTITSTSSGNTSIVSNTGDIYLTPTSATKNVILPANRGILFGESTGEYIRSDGSNNLLVGSGGQITQTSLEDYTITSTTGNILLSPNGYVNIPYNRPLRFGSANETITGTSGNLTLNGNTTNVSGDLVVNGTNTTINSINFVVDDPIITAGTVADDNKDRGFEFNYYNGTAKTGYFGYDDTDGYFMYIPDSTNTDEVISGSLGNAKFATGSFTTINMNGGNLTNVNTITGYASTDLTIDPAPGQDIILNVDSGNNIEIPPNVDLTFDGEDAKFWSDGTDLNVYVASPGRFVIDGETVIDGDLTITGNVNIVGGSTTNLTVERFNVLGGGSSSPNGSSNITFISVTSSGVASGTQTVSSFDGFLKNVCISSLVPGASYELIFPTGRLLNPGTGTTVATKMIFQKPGQSVQMVWDNVLGAYIITQGGGELVLL